ncbi:hypothetical protein BZB76_0224 [Actinomadura pelletieri DSM 43383]|uniref:Uncharacterized protein n=1 Tax=Actinomadura pelletieri DSM 43383 TaxID=1120940 RepID=A0A495QXD3_9ACTN|nr:hypothetical protein BZB76_0224 [Actinomadura pelletieri DSM 43383]
MRKVRIAVACLATAGLVTLIYREIPAMRRYLKMERM